MNRSFLVKFLLALALGLVTLCALDWLDVSAISYPVCLAIVLMGISLRQEPPLVIATSLLYTVLVTCSAFYFLFHSNPFHVPFPIRLFGLVQREGVFIVVCGMAIYLSLYRIASEQTLDDLQRTLGKIPVPVVISDGAGTIIYTNECLRASFKYLPKDLTGQKYIDFFMPGLGEGKATRLYIEIFGLEGNSVKDIDILPFGESVPMHARIICHGNGLKRKLITVLQPPDSTLRPIFLATTDA